MAKSAKKALNKAAAPPPQTIEEAANALADLVKSGVVSYKELVDAIYKAQGEYTGKLYRKRYREIPKLTKQQLGERLLAAAEEEVDHTCHRRSKNYIKRLIEAGADINVRDARGYTPLLAACVSKQLSTAYRLMDHDPDVNATGHDGTTVLNTAIDQGSGGWLVGTLVQRGADVNKPGADGEYPLHRAVRISYPGLVKCLLENNADPLCENRQDEKPVDLLRPDASSELVAMLKKTTEEHTAAYEKLLHDVPQILAQSKNTQPIKPLSLRRHPRPQGPA